MGRFTHRVMLAFTGSLFLIIATIIVQVALVNRASAEPDIVTVSGRLTQTDGSAFSGATLTFTSNSSPSTTHRVITDPDGLYAVDVVAGQYVSTIYRVTDGLTGQNMPTQSELSLTLTSQSFHQATTFDFVVPIAYLKIKAIDLDGSLAVNRFAGFTMQNSYVDYVAAHPELPASNKLIQSYRATGYNYTDLTGVATLTAFNNMPVECPRLSVNVSFPSGVAGNTCDYSRPDIIGDTLIVVQAGAPRPPDGLRPVFSSRRAEPQLSWIQDSSSAISHYQVFRDDILVGTTTNLYYIDASSPPDAVYNYRVKSVSTTGQPSGFSRAHEMVVDKTPPVLSDVSISQQSLGIDERMFRLAVTAEDPTVGYYTNNFFAVNGMVEYYIDNDPGYGNGKQLFGNATGSNAPTIVGNRASFNVQADNNVHLAPGQHTLYVRATDNTATSDTVFYGRAGNWSESVALNFTVPPPPTTSISAGSPVTSGPPTLTIAPLARDGQAYSFSIYRDGVKIGSTEQLTFTDNGATGGASYAYAVKTVHKLYGYEGQVSNSVQITYDNQAPQLTAVSLSPVSMAVGSSATLNVSVQDELSGVSQVSYVLSSDGIERPMTSQGQGVWTAQFGSELVSGDYAVTIVAQDAAGNQSVGGEPLNLTIYNASGSANGRERFVPSESDTLPIERDVSVKPNRAVLNVNNVRIQAGATTPSGSLELSYAVKNNKDEFSFSSTSLQRLTVAVDSSSVEIVGKGTMTIIVGGQQTVLSDVTIKVCIITAGSDTVEVSLYQPDTYSPIAQPAWFISGSAAQGSHLTVNP